MDSCWNRENIMRKICVFASLALMAAMLSVNVYNSIVDARSWSANIPDSILTARNYFKTVNPGTFFRTASPFNQLLALAALVACWKSGRKVRLYFGLAFLLAVLTDALTFAYFYPRNEILFRGYHKFGAEVKIIDIDEKDFPPDKPEETEPKKPEAPPALKPAPKKPQE